MRMNRFLLRLELLSLGLLIPAMPLTVVGWSYHGGRGPTMLDVPAISCMAVFALIELYFDIQRKFESRRGGRGGGDRGCDDTIRETTRRGRRE